MSMNENYSVLVVDDDPRMLDLLKSFLTDEGFRCDTLYRAEDALDRLATDTFDVMVADIRLPGMHGLELTERAKRLRPELNIIVMTAYMEEFSYDDAVAAGASDFIRKPFSFNELALRLRHVRLQEKLRILSITDELTGLPNRRGFFALAEQHLKAAMRGGHNFTLLFADIDNFKAINDTWGHAEGDHALTVMAELFRRSARESDIIARMSGDEFAFLLIDMPESNVRTILDRLEKNIQEFNAGQGRKYQLSVSIGMAVHEIDNPLTIDELLREADRRMYEAKQQKKSGQSRA